MNDCIRPDQPTRLHLSLVVAELIRPYIHTERYEYDADNGTKWSTMHFVKAPSLLEQLDAIQPGGTSSDESNNGSFKSKPATHIESLDLLQRIDSDAAQWVRFLGEDDPADTAACISKLHGLHGICEDERGCNVCGDIRRWWRWARVMTGWDVAAWRPDNTCPSCTKRGSLRIKVIDRLGFCTDCHATWDEYDSDAPFGLLVEHIRWENHEDDTPIEQTGEGVA